MRAAVYGRQSHGKKKSIADQVKLGLALVAAEGWTLVGKYSDAVGASSYSGKAREDWPRVQADVRAGALDVLVLWEPSRGDRKPGEWLAFLESCKSNGVSIYILTDERAYDPRKNRDWKTLATAGIDSAYEVDVMSERSRRGLQEAAEAGAPPTGRAPYGYLRVFDPTTGESTFAPDPETAPVVVEVIERVGNNEAIRSIIRDLEARGIPGPTGGQWYRQRIRLLALNPVYVAQRLHNGTAFPGTWPPLVTDAAHYAAKAVLNAPARVAAGKHARPGRQVHLLSYYATCAPCGGELRAYKQIYSCVAGGHVWVQRAQLDGLVEELVLARLADPDVYAALRRAGEVDAARAEQLEGEVGRLLAQLEEWRASAVRGETSPASLAAIERGLQERIDSARAELTGVVVPDALRGYVGGPSADVAARWAAAPVQARRAVLRALGLRVAVRPVVGIGRPVHERIEDPWPDDVS